MFRSELLVYSGKKMNIALDFFTNRQNSSTVLARTSKFDTYTMFGAFYTTWKIFDVPNPNPRILQTKVTFWVNFVSQKWFPNASQMRIYDFFSRITISIWMIFSENVSKTILNLMFVTEKNLVVKVIFRGKLMKFWENLLKYHFSTCKILFQEKSTVKIEFLRKKSMSSILFENLFLRRYNVPLQRVEKKTLKFFDFVELPHILYYYPYLLYVTDFWNIWLWKFE